MGLHIDGEDVVASLRDLPLIVSTLIGTSDDVQCAGRSVRDLDIGSRSIEPVLSHVIEATGIRSHELQCTSLELASVDELMLTDLLEGKCLADIPAIGSIAKSIERLGLPRITLGGSGEGLYLDRTVRDVEDELIRPSLGDRPLIVCATSDHTLLGHPFVAERHASLGSLDVGTSVVLEDCSVRDELEFARLQCTLIGELQGAIGGLREDRSLRR